MKFSVLSLTSTQQSEFESLARGLGSSAGYRWLGKSDIPTAVPISLRSKMPASLMMWERTSSGCTVIVCNGVRLDAKANALDQEPFGVAVYSSGASTGGIFAHHGSWRGRSIPITPQIQQLLDSTRLADYYPLGGVPSKSSGPLSDLSHTGHEGAFRTVLGRILSKST
jgi:hypothetical protein